MTSRWSTHVVWGVVAAVAFAVGAVFFPDNVVSGDAVQGRVAQAPAEAGDRGAEAELGVLAGEAARGVEVGGVRRGALSEFDIESLGELMRTVGSPVEKRLAFAKLLSGLTVDNALAVRKQIEHLDDGSAEFREFHYAWGAVAGAEAAMSGADTPEDDMAPALAGWASADADAALAWFGGLDMENDPAFEGLLKEREIPLGDLKNHLMAGLIRGVAVADPNRAAGLVQRLVEEGNHSGYGMMRSVVDTVLRGGAEGAASWAEALENDKLRYVAMEQVAGTMVRRDFENAVEWAASVASRPEGAGVVASVGGAMARNRPDEAMEWLDSLPDGHGKNQGVGRAMWQWTERDAQAASDYLATMDVGTARDSAVGAFARRLSGDDPETAVSWAATIGDEKARIRLLVEAGQQWSRRDPNGAMEWVLDSGLSEEVQLKILTPEEE